ncbi:MAG: DUF2306 domain-containing protein [Neoaquamicrobium sediminum]|uniref:DUF2306 domain-containing protein n=1 Tax=Neoaquamicrobium sediminum TaxID=1849104 RepID=UPI004035B654
MTLAPLQNASFAIQIHVAIAVLAFLLGGLVLFRTKGDKAHRMAGKIWVVLMLVVAITSFFIHTIRLVGPWSPIHLLSIITLWSLYSGIRAARRKRILEHRRTMQSLYLGALVIAGGFSFLPGRIMHEVFFDGPHPWMGMSLAAAIAAVVLWLAWRSFLVRRLSA